MFLGGAASVDSWCREIYVPWAWRVFLATGIDFYEKTMLVLGQSEPDRQPPILALYYEGKVKTIFPKNFMYVLRTTTILHMVSFISFPFFHVMPRDTASLGYL